MKEQVYSPKSLSLSPLTTNSHVLFYRYELYVGQPPFYTNSVYTLIRHIVKVHAHRVPVVISRRLILFVIRITSQVALQKANWYFLGRCVVRKCVNYIYAVKVELFCFLTRYEWLPPEVSRECHNSVSHWLSNSYILLGPGSSEVPWQHQYQF